MTKDERTIVIFALRYALHRKTFALSTVLDYITQNIAEFEKWEIDLIEKELTEVIGYDNINDVTINEFLKGI